jgi:outer membrane protein TolC
MEAVATSNLLFKTGKATYLEVIAAQRNVIDAELQLVDTKRQMFLSLTNLYRSLGGGWK